VKLALFVHCGKDTETAITHSIEGHQSNGCSTSTTGAGADFSSSSGLELASATDAAFRSGRGI